MATPRMRTVPEAYKELKKIDTETGLTFSGLKRLVQSGKVPYIEVGRKKLINLDMLFSMLCMPAEASQSAINNSTKHSNSEIRPVTQ